MNTRAHTCLLDLFLQLVSGKVKTCPLDFLHISLLLLRELMAYDYCKVSLLLKQVVFMCNSTLMVWKKKICSLHCSFTWMIFCDPCLMLQGSSSFSYYSLTNIPLLSLHPSLALYVHPCIKGWLPCYPPSEFFLLCNPSWTICFFPRLQYSTLEYELAAGIHRQSLTPSNCNKIFL